MRNREGFATIGVMIAILITTLIVMTIFLNPIFNTSIEMKKSKDIIPEYINNMSGIERVYSVFKENMSHNTNITLEDLNKDYKIEQVEEGFSDVNLQFSGAGVFHVNNKTDIDILFEVHPIDTEKSHSYNINLALNDSANIANKDNLMNDTTINVPENFLYNEDTGEINYGDYKVSTETTNCNVIIKVSYSKLDHREIDISNGNIEQTLVIDNQTRDDDTIIYFNE